MNVICRVAGEGEKGGTASLVPPYILGCLSETGFGGNMYYVQISDAIHSEFEIFRTGKRWCY